MRRRRRKGRGLGSYTPAEVDARVARVGQDVAAGDCPAAFQSVRNLESVIAKSPKDPSFNTVLRNYGNAVKHFADRCIVKARR